MEEDVSEMMRPFLSNTYVTKIPAIPVNSVWCIFAMYKLRGMFDWLG